MNKISRSIAHVVAMILASHVVIHLLDYGVEAFKDLTTELVLKETLIHTVNYIKEEF
jgi:hypothetical protein